MKEREIAETVGASAPSGETRDRGAGEGLASTVSPSGVWNGEHCDACGRGYDDVWWCEDELLWRGAYRRLLGRDPGEGGLLCPGCFASGQDSG